MARKLLHKGLDVFDILLLLALVCAGTSRLVFLP